MSQSKWAVVVPSNRPESLAQFEIAWDDLFDLHEVTLYRVIDAAPWRDVPAFIPRCTDMIRSWGFYRAWADGADYIMSLDDDVRPCGDLFYEYETVFDTPQPCSPYLSVGTFTDTGHEMRGFPYVGRTASVAVQYGGWHGVPDLDAVTQLNDPGIRGNFTAQVMPVPKGAPTTCCAMNFAFRTDYTPLMWQLPLHNGLYNRMGDIWSGLVAKRVLDAHGLVACINGEASVIHQRASDPFKNLEREAPGLRINEELWDGLCVPTDVTLTGKYRQVTDSAVRVFWKHNRDYAKHFEDCRNQWLELFQ